MKDALGLPPPSQVAPQAAPEAAPQAPPIPGPSGAPLPAAGVLSSAPPPIVVEEDSDDGVQTLAVPFRASSTETYLPMVSTDDSWSTDAEFRFVFYMNHFIVCSGIFFRDLCQPTLLA